MDWYSATREHNRKYIFIVVFPHFIFWECQSMKSGEKMENEKVKTTEQVIDDKPVERPSEQPPKRTVQSKLLFGRTVIYADYTEDELTMDTIKQILVDVWSVHLHNACEIDYLEKYYKGIQPILWKTKEIRPNINNTIVENNAYGIVEFKKSYVFGKPIQYVQRGDIANAEVGALNSYMLAEGKYTKDTVLSENLYKIGIAHRIVMPEINEDSPFDIRNLDSKTTFCVYSSYDGKKLFGCNYSIGVKTGNIRGNIYTKNAYYKFDKNLGDTSFDVKFVKGHILGVIPIFEYYLNESRLGIIEVVMSILDNLNKITSNELDGLEQFVQSILVFVNQDIDKKDLEGLLDLGAVKIASSDPQRPADVKFISNEIKHDNTKILHDRLFNTALQIIGIPKNSDKASGGDTGQARYLGEGWTMADARADQDEAFFKECAKEELKLILKICRMVPNSEIKTLSLKDIDQKFTRNKSDNFLVKSQGMMNQIQSGVSPDVAMTTSGLYSDPNETYNKSMEFYGGVENWIKLFIDKANKQIEENKSQTSSKKQEENGD